MSEGEKEALLDGDRKGETDFKFARFNDDHDFE